MQERTERTQIKVRPDKLLHRRLLDAARAAERSLSAEAVYRLRLTFESEATS
jgi:hypothetical protein